MPRNSRCVLPGTPYHITQRGNDRQRVFFLNSDREHSLDLLHRNLAYTHTRLHAFCLMADHIHAVVVPDRPDFVALLFRRVHGPYAAVRQHPAQSLRTPLAEPLLILSSFI